MRLIRLISIPFLFVLALSACRAQELDNLSIPASTPPVPVAGGGTYLGVAPDELAAMLENGDFFLVNVQNDPQGVIPGTDAAIAFDEIPNYLSEFPGEKDAKIVVYCRNGNQGAIAASTLVDLGYSDVYNLEGGLQNWGYAGYDITAVENTYIHVLPLITK